MTETANVPTQRARRRTEGRCRSGAGCSRHVWLVTAANRRPRTEPSEPWGTYHLKANGALLTACGEYAVGWRVFWGHAVSPLDRAACRACLRVATGAPTTPSLTLETREWSRA